MITITRIKLIEHYQELKCGDENNLESWIPSMMFDRSPWVSFPSSSSTLAKI